MDRNLGGIASWKSSIRDTNHGVRDVANDVNDVNDAMEQMRQWRIRERVVTNVDDSSDMVSLMTVTKMQVLLYCIRMEYVYIGGTEDESHNDVGTGVLVALMSRWHDMA